MKRVIIFAIFCSILLLAGRSSFACELLYNPCFENGVADWEYISVPWDASTTEHYCGDLSATQQVVYNNDTYWSQLYQEVPIVAGQALYGRAYAKTTFLPLSGAKAGLMLQFFNSSGAQIGSTINANAIGGNTGWRLLEATATAAPSGTATARISLFLYAPKGEALKKGSAYFDNVYIDKTYRELVRQNSLLNVGFENGVADWQFSGYPSSVSTVKYGGVYSAKNVVANVSTQDYWGQLYQDVACLAGQQVTAGAYAKTEMNAAAGSVAGMQVEFLDPAGNVLKFSSSGVLMSKYYKQIVGKTDWRKLAMPVTTAPVGTAKVRLSVYVWVPKGNTLSVNGAAYFDNAYLTITTPVAAVK